MGSAAAKKQVGTEPLALEWVRPPMQSRSQQTLERLLLAAEEMIGEVGFDKVTVAGIVKRAGSSVGAFYTRFKDKDALLQHMVERFLDEAFCTIDRALSPQMWEGASIESFTRTLIGFALRMFDQRRQLVAAVSSAANQRSDGRTLRNLLTERVAAGIGELLEARGEESARGDTNRALVAASWMLFSVLENSAHQEQLEPPGMTREELVNELTDMITTYLAICPKT